MQLIDEVEEQRGREDQAIHTVQDAAVTGQQRPHVFDPVVALHGGNGNVAHETGQADQQAGDESLPGVEWAR